MKKRNELEIRLSLSNLSFLKRATFKWALVAVLLFGWTVGAVAVGAYLVGTKKDSMAFQFQMQLGYRSGPGIRPDENLLRAINPMFGAGEAVRGPNIIITQ